MRAFPGVSTQRSREPSRRASSDATTTSGSSIRRPREDEHPSRYVRCDSSVDSIASNHLDSRKDSLRATDGEAEAVPVHPATTRSTRRLVPTPRSDFCHAARGREPVGRARMQGISPLSVHTRRVLPACSPAAEPTYFTARTPSVYSYP